MTYTMKNTTELSTGDVVRHHGMRVELGERTERTVSDDMVEGLISEGHAPVVVSFVGTILNVEEVNEAGVVPFSWRCMTEGQHVGTARYSDKGDRWTVQGNGRAKWAVEN